MEKINAEQLDQIYGGGAGYIIIGIIAFCTLIAGIIDGLVRPLSCDE